MSRPPEITFTDDQEVSAALFQRAFDWVYGQLRAAQAQQPDVARALADLQANGLTRLAATLGPVFERTVALDEHLRVLEAQYLGDGVVPAILAQAAASVDGKLLVLGNEQDAQLAAYAGIAAAMFAAKVHGHTIGDVVGLQLALDAKRPASVELFTTGGTWTRPSGLTAAFAVAIGGGGGGGGGAAYAGFPNDYSYGGSGGGGGGRSALMLRGNDCPVSATVAIGAGGLGGAGGSVDQQGNTFAGATGGTGGFSSFGSLLIAGGGVGGIGGGKNTNGQGGVGGVGLAAGGPGVSTSGGGDAANPFGLGAGGGGCGNSLYGNNIDAGSATRGGLSIARAAPAASGSGSPATAAGIDAPSAEHGGGGGAGGHRSAGWPGGRFGGGGGGGGVTNAGGSFRGGNGAPGAVLILNIF